MNCLYMVRASGWSKSFIIQEVYVVVTCRVLSHAVARKNLAQIAASDWSKISVKHGASNNQPRRACHVYFTATAFTVLPVAPCKKHTQWCQTIGRKHSALITSPDLLLPEQT